MTPLAPFQDLAPALGFPEGSQGGQLTAFDSPTALRILLSLLYMLDAV
jgi:hypothetical protein